MSVIYYIDSVNGDNANDGLTPANSFADFEAIPRTDDDLNGGQIVYIRRGTEIDAVALTYNYRILSLIGWDAADTDRPQAGIDAGWDADDGEYPKITSSIAVMFTNTDGSIDNDSLTLRNLIFFTNYNESILFSSYDMIIDVENVIFYGQDRGLRPFRFNDRSTKKHSSYELNIRNSELYGNFVEEEDSTRHDILLYANGNVYCPIKINATNLKIKCFNNFMYKYCNTGFTSTEEYIHITDSDISLGQYGLMCYGEYISATLYQDTNIDIVFTNSNIEFRDSGINFDNNNSYYFPFDLTITDSTVICERELYYRGDDARNHYGKLDIRSSSMIGRNDYPMIKHYNAGYLLIMTEVNIEDTEISGFSRIFQGYSTSRSYVSGEVNIELDNRTSGMTDLFYNVNMTDVPPLSKIKMDSLAIPILFSGCLDPNINVDINQVVITNQMFYNTELCGDKLSIIDSSVNGSISCNNTDVSVVGSKLTNTKFINLRADVSFSEVRASAGSLLDNSSLKIRRSIIDGFDNLGRGRMSLYQSTLKDINTSQLEYSQNIITSASVDIKVDGVLVNEIAIDDIIRDTTLNINGVSIDNTTNTVFKFAVADADVDKFSSASVFYPTTVGELGATTLTVSIGDVADWENIPSGFSPLEIVFDKNYLAEIPANYAVIASIGIARGITSNRILTCNP